MSGVLVYPSRVCGHDLTTHCDTCIVELILPSLQVLICSWYVFDHVLSGHLSDGASA